MPMLVGRPRTMKMNNPLYFPLGLRGDEGGLRLRLRSPFRLGSDGYVNFFKTKNVTE
jgi:hypothetical protein